MTSARLWTGIGGILFVLSIFYPLLHIRVAEIPADADAATLERHLTDSRAGFESQWVSHMLGVFFLVAFLAGLWPALRAAEGDAGPHAASVLLAGSAAAATMASSMALVAAAMSMVGSVPAEHLRVVYELAWMTWVATGIPFALLLGTLGIAGLRTKFIPAWLAWWGVAFLPVAVLAFALPVAMPGNEAALAPQFGALALGSLWVLAASVLALAGRLGPGPSRRPFTP